jgi:mannose-1-phosphate guanylyltransferase
MILAAGFGRRLRPLSLARPKPLFPVLNKTMLEWWAEALASAGVKRLIINVHYQPEMMLERIERLAECYRGRLEILASPETEVLGTGGGLAQAAALLGSTEFLVVNADIFTDFELVKLSLKHLANPGRLATLGLLRRPDNANVALAEGGRILGFRSPAPLPGETARLTYCGVMALSPAIFDWLPPGASDLVEAFNRALAGGADISGWVYDPAIWRDIGTPESYWGLNNHLAAGRAILHSTAQVTGTLSGWNVLGAGAQVLEGATAENCVIWPSAVISRGAAVKNAVIAGVVPPRQIVNGGVFCHDGS